jgi:hypothetical protein
MTLFNSCILWMLLLRSLFCLYLESGLFLLSLSSFVLFVWWPCLQFNLLDPLNVAALWSGLYECVEHCWRRNRYSFMFFFKVLVVINWYFVTVFDIYLFLGTEISILFEWDNALVAVSGMTLFDSCILWMLLLWSLFCLYLVSGLLSLSLSRFVLFVWWLGFDRRLTLSIC